MTSYSATGVHPQCAARSADLEWTKRMKAKRAEIAVVPEKTAKFYQRCCPKCNVIQHVRAKTCECGYVFPIKMQAAADK